jgi:hypothetical protein
MAVRKTVAAALVAAACGCGSNPVRPSPSCFAIVGNHGSMTATISGLPSFSGIIPNASNVRTVTAIPAGATFTIQATDVSDGTSVLVAGPIKLGTTGVSLTDPDGQTIQVILTTRSCATATGVWSASLATGTASITLTSASATGVSGSFTATVTPNPGSPASGNKTVSGSFSVTF